MGWLVYFIGTAFCFWIVFLGGAENLEGRLSSAILIQASATSWTAAGIKLYTVISWLAVTFSVFVF